MKRIHAIALAIAWLLAPVAGQAGDVTGGLGGEVEFDSNARRTSTNEQKDVIFRISPYVRVLEDQGKLTYDVRYRFPWEKAIEVQRVDGFRHFVNARGEYNFSERTVLTLVNNFIRADTVNSISSQEDGVASINTFSEPVNRNNLRLSLAHNFTPRIQTTGTFNFRLFDSDLPGRANNRTYGLNIENTYQLTPRHRVGGGVSVDYQDFDASNNGNRSPSQTLFANVFGSWSWFIDETTTFEIAAGPTFIDTNQDSTGETVEARSIPTFSAQSDGELIVNNVGTCGTDTIDGQTVQVLQVNNICAGGAIVDDQGYDLFLNGLRVQGEDWDDRYPGQGDQIRGEIAQLRDSAVNAASLDFFPGEPESLSDTSWTIFAQVALTKRWTPSLISTASYTRRDSTASGIAGSAVLDLISLLTTWQITELWDGALRADFTQRESTGPVNENLFVVGNAPSPTDPTALDLTGSPAFGTADPDRLFTDGSAYATSFTTRRRTQTIDTTRWGIQARIRRRITRNLSTGLRYTFNRQSSRTGSAGNFSDFNDHLVTLNVQYDFDRWNAW